LLLQERYFGFSGGPSSLGNGCFGTTDCNEQPRVWNNTDLPSSLRDCLHFGGWRAVPDRLQYRLSKQWTFSGQCELFAGLHRCVRWSWDALCRRFFHARGKSGLVSTDLLPQESDWGWRGRCVRRGDGDRELRRLLCGSLESAYVEQSACDYLLAWMTLMED
jgi:hypothetical protein